MPTAQEISPGSYHLKWQGDFRSDYASIFHGAAPHEIGKDSVTAADQYRETTVTGLPNTRQYFEIVADSGESAIVAQRNVPLAGAVNFRDLGGYPTEDQRITKWGALYRSGHLSRLTDNDQVYVGELGIQTICDFRRETEIVAEASAIPEGIDTHIVPIVPGSRDVKHITDFFAAAEGPQDVVEAMVDINRSLVVESAPQYRGLFDLLLKHQSGAFLMNCSAGKERTGVATVLVLSALGVSPEVIEYDFMLSEQYYPAEQEVARVQEKYLVDTATDEGRALVMPLLETRKAYIEVVFEEIFARSSSPIDFVQSTYQLSDRDIEQLRQTFTV